MDDKGRRLADRFVECAKPGFLSIGYRLIRFFVEKNREHLHIVFSGRFLKPALPGKCLYGLNWHLVLAKPVYLL